MKQAGWLEIELNQNKYKLLNDNWTKHIIT